MSTHPIDPATCPLCGQVNACGVVAGHADCWCFSTVIPPSVLASIPADAQDKACVCATCARGTASAASPTPSPAPGPTTS